MFSVQEIIHAIILTVGIAYIFSDMFRSQRASYAGYRIERKWYEPYMLAAIAIVPAIIVHETFHKFTAISFGAEATFYAAFQFLLFGIVLKLIGSPIIIIAPAFVSFSGNILPWQIAIVAFMGPIANLLLWGVFTLILTLDIPRFAQWRKNPTIFMILLGSQKINFLLFWFNLLPIPGFDGWYVWSYLFSLIAGAI